MLKLTLFYMRVIAFVSQSILPLPLGLLFWLLTEDDKAAFHRSCVSKGAEVSEALAAQAVDMGMARQMSAKDRARFSLSNNSRPDYVAICDHCHVLLTGSGGSIEEAHAFALAHGWQDKAGDLFCPNCMEVTCKNS
jgi:hypothetical protein